MLESCVLKKEIGDGVGLLEFGPDLLYELRVYLMNAPDLVCK